MYAVTEAAIQRCSVKKVFLKISQNSQENTCARVSFKFLRTPFFIEHLRWLLLHLSTMAQKRKQLQEELEESPQFYVLFVEALTTLLIK